MYMGKNIQKEFILQNLGRTNCSTKMEDPFHQYRHVIARCSECSAQHVHKKTDD